MSPSELLAAMKADFKGYETLRLRLLEADKYGNDLKEVDEFAQRFHHDVCTIVRSQKDRTALHSYLVVIINNEANTVLGRFTGPPPTEEKPGSPWPTETIPPAGRIRGG